MYRKLSRRVAQVQLIQKNKTEIEEALKLVKSWPGSANLNLNNTTIKELINSHTGEFRTDEPQSIFVNVSNATQLPTNQPPPGTNVEAIVNYISLGATIVHELEHKKRHDTGYFDKGFSRNIEENLAETEQEKFVQWAIQEYAKHGLQLQLKK